MSSEKSGASEAAALLNSYWGRGEKLEILPPPLCPRSRQEGYRIADAVAKRRGEQVAGWKIAATSKAGQSHINVDGPLAGRLYESRVLSPGSRISLKSNLMRVAEVEFAFRFANDLRSTSREYTVSDVMASVGSLHLSIEIPDSRYRDFTKVGAPSLIADTACADWLVIGPAVEIEWRHLDLAEFEVRGIKNNIEVAKGSGRAALGDPRIALTWLVNELCQFADGVKRGTLVTTGTCVVPVAIDAGDHFVADYGVLGHIDVYLDA